MAPAARFRKHVTKACNRCRESKLKCDGMTPICSRCSRAHKECHYELREDRRKISLRIAVDLLFSRVDQLSRFITDQGLELPPMKDDDDKKLSDILQGLGLQHESKPKSGQSLQNDICPPVSLISNGSSPELGGTPSLLADTQTSPGLLCAGSNSVGPIVESSITAHSDLDFFAAQNSSSSSYEDLEVESFDESEDELVKQLSDRIGTLHIKPGGHIRYFGATSNFHLLETSASDGAIPIHRRTVRGDGMGCLNSLGIGKEVPSDIEEHLVNLYFSWQDPATHVVDRQIYEDAREKWHSGVDTPYYSETLRNAICAVGAAFDTRYHPAFVTFPRSLADFFSDRARMLLEIELDSSPSVATVQALVILSAHDVGNGADTRGWLFSGMAMRLVYVLALHQDLSKYVAKGLISQGEADLRQVVFWSACVVDHVWSFYLGQPFRFSMENATVEKPTFNKEKIKKWVPYTTPITIQTTHIDCTELVCQYQALLFEAMSPLSTTLYGSLSIPKTTLQEMNARTVASLLTWKDTLPVELQVDNATPDTPLLPHVLLMHMQFHHAIIYAHRPYMSKSYLQPSPPQGPGAGHARQMCIDSASSVARLLSLYEARFSLRRMNVQGVAITFSAALILIFVTISHRPQEEQGILGHLGTCFRALDELGSTWESARRARDFIVKVQRHWETQASLRSWPRRPHSNKPKSSSLGNDRQASLGRPEDDSLDYLAFPRGTSSGLGDDALEFNMDMDLDWMLTADLQGRPENWGSFFAVSSGDNSLPARYSH